MKADYHIHSNFSDDSTEDLDQIALSAIHQNIDEICITEHVDYGVKLDKDEWEKSDKKLEMNADYERFFPAMDTLREKYKEQLTIKTGLEFGMQTITIESFQKLFNKYPLDFVILSCHEVDNLEFWTGEFQKGRKQDEYQHLYYEEIYKVIQMYKDYSILGHLDLIQRYSDTIEPPLKKHFDIIEAILKQVIYDGKGIEINTSNVRYKLEDLTPAYDILKLYYELGGEVITVGSDAHVAEDVGDRLDISYDVLREIGFRYITTFDKMKPAFHKL